MAKTVQIKPEEAFARAYADRLILEKLTELHVAVKLSELADKLQGVGIGLAAIRSLLASNPQAFAYSERRWVPAARLEAKDRPLRENLRLLVDRFGGPMPYELILSEMSHRTGRDGEIIEPDIRRMIERDEDLFFTDAGEVALGAWCFRATDESVERALGLYGVDADELDAARGRLSGMDWRAPDAVSQALAKAAPVGLKTLGAAAWMDLNAQDPRSVLIYDWKEIARQALATKGYVYAADGSIHPEAEAKKWISAAIKVAEKLAPTVEIEDAAPIELKPEDVERAVKKIVSSDSTVTATRLLEEMYEITPSVRTFPDDLANIMAALRSRTDVWWVGGDRFRKPGTAPDFVSSLPEPFQFSESSALDEEGEPVDFELTDDGLSTSLRKLILHPLATDVLDEEILPAPKAMAENLRLVLKPIHRELGTFPLSQIPTGWMDTVPGLQELIFIDPNGRELQVWANTDVRLLFNLVDWWYEQPIESGAVFSLTKTVKPNVFEFTWLDQPDPVVFISSQRMEELREISARSDEMSAYDILREVMAHWPKGADFLTILWEVNVVRRMRRRLVASLLSSYACFYQRSGSPVWHFDAKKVDQGVDKTKRKFIRK